MGSRQKVNWPQDDSGDRDEDDGHEYDYEEQGELGDNDMVLG